MLSVHQLSKTFDLDPLFENVTFSVNRGERVGLIGPNGSGKTTLFRIVTGEIKPTSGHISHSADLRIGYLPQGFELDPNKTLGETIDLAAGNIDALESELAEVAMAMAEAPDDVPLQERYDDLLGRIISAETGTAASITAALGLDQIDPSLPNRVLSGGQKTRLSLALILLNQPDLLLLDEPTNHLDIDMLQWLETWLAGFRGGVLLISHDRNFLDKVCTTILDLNSHTKKVKAYPGNYSDYLAAWSVEREKQWQAYYDQIEEVKRLKRDIARVRETARSQENKSTSVRKGGEKMKLKGYKDFVRSKAKATAQLAKARDKKLDRYLESDERVEKPTHGWQMQVQFSPSQHLGKSVLHMENLAIGYADNQILLTIPNRYIQSGQRIAFTGANGSGKTTLLRTLMGRIAPLSGRLQWGSSVNIGYMSQEQVLLDPKQTPVETLLGNGFANQTDARTFLHKYLFAGDEALKPIELLSYGQRSRLELALLVAQGCNVLLLDEPVNHLDIPSRELFEQALTQFAGTILAVMHDRTFIERFATEVWWLENRAIRVELQHALESEKSQ